PGSPPGHPGPARKPAPRPRRTSPSAGVPARRSPIRSRFASPSRGRNPSRCRQHTAGQSGRDRLTTGTGTAARFLLLSERERVRVTATAGVGARTLALLAYRLGERVGLPGHGARGATSSSGSHFGRTTLV